MPYEIKKVGAKYEVKNKATGKGHGKTTKVKAEAQKRLLEMIMKRKGEK